MMEPHLADVLWVESPGWNHFREQTAEAFLFSIITIKLTFSISVELTTTRLLFDWITMILILFLLFKHIEWNLEAGPVHLSIHPALCPILFFLSFFLSPLPFCIFVGSAVQCVCIISASFILPFFFSSYSLSLSLSLSLFLCLTPTHFPLLMCFCHHLHCHSLHCLPITPSG